MSVIPSPLGSGSVALAVSRIAATQHGAFSTHQARAVGARSNWLTRAARRGFIARAAPSVWIVVGAPPTARQNLMVHVLTGGPLAVASGEPALGLWVPAEFTLPWVPEVSVPRRKSLRTGTARVSWRSDLHLAKPTTVDGIPTTGVARALLDVSDRLTVDDVISRIDDCQRHLRSMSIGALVDALTSHARSGRHGIVTFRQALAGLNSQVSASEFERLVVRDLVAAGLPEPRLHHMVHPPVLSWPVELDIDWPGVLLDVELDGRDHKVRVEQFERDRERDRALGEMGYQVARYTWKQYVTDPDALIAQIARFREADQPSVSRRAPLPIRTRSTQEPAGRNS